MCKRSQGRRLEIDQAIGRNRPNPRRDRADYFNFISAIQHRSDLLNHDSCRFMKGCNSADDVLKRLLVIFRLRHRASSCIYQWNPDLTQSPHQQYCDLVRHLFVIYDVPAWLLKCSSIVDLRALIHIGTGGSLRTAWPRIKVSKSMARALWQAPVGMRRYEAFNWARMKTLGASDRLAKILCRCGPSSFCTDEFWATVVRFFVRCERDESMPLLDEEIPTAIKFIREIKFLSARVLLGQRVRIDAGPIRPDFSLEGRNLRWLRRRMANWKEEALADLDVEPVRNELVWQPSAISGFDLAAQNGQWRIYELCNSWRLRNEGKQMHHCVGSYARWCSKGKSAIWTVRKTDTRTNSTRSMATIEVNPRARMIVQIRSKYNSNPSVATMQVIRQWANSQDLRLEKVV